MRVRPATLPIPAIPEAQRARILSRVVKTQVGCWELRANLAAGGYGRIRIGGRQYLAHRCVFAMLKGEVPTDKVVCHTCDNPKCVNPEHLFLGSQADNIRDCVRKGRSHNPRPKALPEYCRRCGYRRLEDDLANKNGVRFCRNCKKLNRRARYERLMAAEGRPARPYRPLKATGVA